MRYASIDIGSNSILLLIADSTPSSSLIRVADYQRIPRLGRGVDAAGQLSLEAIQDSLDVLREYSAIISAAKAETTLAVGTRAMREAANAALLVQLAELRHGIQIEILSGHEEAVWGYRGVISDAPEISAPPFLVIDVGGGSTELTVGDRNGISYVASLPVGSVRIRERYFHNDPPSRDEIEQAREFVREEFEKVQFGGRAPDTVFAIAGAATTLGAIELKMESWDPDRFHDFLFTREALGGLLRRLSVMPAKEIASMPQVAIGREDVLFAGGVILEELIFLLAIKEFRVSDRGIRHGIILRDLEQKSRT